MIDHRLEAEAADWIAGWLRRIEQAPRQCGWYSVSTPQEIRDGRLTLEYGPVDENGQPLGEKR